MRYRPCDSLSRRLLRTHRASEPHV